RDSNNFPELRRFSSCSIVKQSSCLNPEDNVRTSFDICAGYPRSSPIDTANVRMYVPLLQRTEIGNRTIPSTASYWGFSSINSNWKIVTDRFGLSTSFPSRAYSYKRFPWTFTAEYIGGI